MIMPIHAYSLQAAETLARVRTQRPLIQNVTNYVVMNDTANAILQAGGSPVMAHENVEMTRHAHAVVLNMGTLDDFWLQQMQSIGQEANRQGIPVVFDPVGAGATAYRTGTRKHPAYGSAARQSWGDHSTAQQALYAYATQRPTRARRRQCQSLRRRAYCCSGDVSSKGLRCCDDR